MRKFIFLVLLLAGLSASGQNHYLGFKIGSNFSNLSSSTDLLKDSKNKTGLLAGISYQYELFKFLQLGADLQYSQKGYKLGVTFTDEVGNVIGEGDIVTAMNYISIPIKAGVNFGKRLSVFANLGIVPSFLGSAKLTVPDYAQGESKSDINESVKDFDFGGLIEIGGSLKFLGRLQAFVNVSYEHSFTAFNEDPYFGDANLNLYGFGIAAGLQYALKK